MKTIAGLAFLLCSAPLAGEAVAQDRPEATAIAPSLWEYVQYIEANIKLPPEAGPLDSYERYYAIDPDLPERVMGQYVQKGVFSDLAAGESPTAAVHLVVFKDFPWIADGNCANDISVNYLASTRKIQFFCREHPPGPPPPPEPKWPKSPP